MAPIRFILAATDFSPEGNNAVWRAAAMARQSGARMGIVHVVDPAGYQPLRDWMMPCYPLDQKEARGLAQARQLAIDVANGHGLTPSVHVPVGDVSEEVVCAAAQADLLVLGRPHRRRLRDLLTVRTADRILRASRRPVLVSWVHTTRSWCRSISAPVPTPHCVPPRNWRPNRHFGCSMPWTLLVKP